MGMGWRVKKLIQDFRYRKVDIGDNSRINLGVQINNLQILLERYAYSEISGTSILI